MSTLGTPRVLVRRGVDGLLVGWLAVIVWLAVFAAHRLDLHVDLPGYQVVYWTGIVVVAAHFGVSYHLAYRGGLDAIRTRPFALLSGPVMLAGVLGATIAVALAGGADTAAQLSRALITSVFLMTTWHYVKQVYGVGRIGAAYAGVKLGTWDVRVLRYGLYPMWFLGAAQVLTQGPRGYTAGVEIGYGLLPRVVLDVLQALSVASAVPLLVVFLGIIARSRKIPSLLTAPYLSAFLWLALPTDPVLLALLLAAFHALQYLAIAHRAEVSLAADTPDARGLGWWLNIFAGAACGGLLLSRWAPHVLDNTFAPGKGLLFTAGFFVFLNLHHYLIDATIWRSKGELIKALGRPQGRPVVAEKVVVSG